MKPVTRGKWVAETNGIIYAKHISDGRSEGTGRTVGQANTYGYTAEETAANAEIMADAGNVYQECGLTPSQLMEHYYSTVKP